MSTRPLNSIPHISPDILLTAMQNVVLSPSPGTDTASSDDSPPPFRPFVSYTHAQILFLYKSPLVSPPKGMPLLKDWFGDWNEQNASKKDSDSSAATSGARDKRFRRDQEDAAELPQRAPFRSTLTQPSQMGNFKHQSIRSSEREKDKDADRDRERDLRDKEGQERLRSLSDKYDRDRLSSPAGGTSLRTRERDSAPHLVGSTGRLSSQGNLGSGATRRTDGRDSSRRKAGESSEDWRRGREERSDGLRRERDDRERPRSRVRDSSRQRRDASPTRRERELDRDRDRDRDEHRRRDGRDRDLDRETNDDPRRWRDDGKRDERMAARRELRDKEFRERERDREREREKERGSRVSERESNWDSDRNRDRERDRWVLDERDSRSKRPNGRDRPGHSRDEDRDERKDSRVRVEEKEPAWMDTYIPSESGVGILGGKAENGELDGIQAWKLGMKEKERKERESEVSRSSGDAEHASGTQTTDSQAVPPLEPPLDEIQLFKLMIKREEEKNKAASLNGPINDPAVAYFIPGTDSAASTQKLSTEAQMTSNFVPSPSVEALAPPAVSSTKSSSPSIESPKAPGSRFFPNPSTSDNAALQGQQDSQSASAIRSPMPSQFNPPPGSRLLALGSRTPSATATTNISPDQPSAFTIPASSLDAPPHLQHPVNGPHRIADIDTSNPDSTARSSVATDLPPPGFSNFINPNRLTGLVNESSAQTQSESFRRQSLVSLGDRMTYGGTSDFGAYSEMGSTNSLGPQSNTPNSQSPSFDSVGRERGHGGSPFPQQKGSRFAKFFDAKSREQSAAAATEDLSPLAHPLLPYQRQQGGVGGESYTLGSENRTMEDIFAMLQSSTQGQRLAQPSGYGQTPFIQQPGNISTTRQPQLAPVGRNHDVLYDNRLDDRNFVPNGLVPGLRSSFPLRRDSGMFQDPLDELSAFNVQQRMPPQRAVDQMYSAPPPPMYPNQTNVPRSSGLPVQQPFRNGNSPNATHLHSSPQHRLPPGLANLGGRPPHDPSQFLGSIVGVPSHLQGNGSVQPGYNFSSGNMGYPAGPQVRGPPGVSPNIQNTVDHNHGVSILHANKLDGRAATQAQLGLDNGAGAGQRAPGVGFPQQNALPMHVPHAAMRQQPHLQQQQPHPQAISHLLPQHIQASSGSSPQPAQDLMALLMHGASRD